MAVNLGKGGGAGKGGIRVDVSFKNDSDVNSVAAKVWRPVHGQNLAQEIENIMSKKNWPQAFAEGQGKWKPLTPKYVLSKTRQGYPAAIWKRTGATFKALTTTANMGLRGGRVRGRQVLITRNDGGVVELEHRVQPPAANGWFDRNNVIRPLMVVLPQAQALITEKIRDFVLNNLARAGWRTRG